MPGILLIVSGPSGAGKGTVVKELVKDTAYALSISATTRAPRTGEEHGREYYFISRTQFEEFIDGKDGNNLLEYAEYAGNYYGTPHNYVLQQVQDGKVVVLEIDVVGGLQVKAKYPDAVLVFLAPPSLKELERRLVSRGTEDAQTIARRLSIAEGEMERAQGYDYFVINDMVENAVANINAIVIAEQLRPARRR